METTCLLFAYGLLKSAYRPPKSLRRCWPDRIRARLFDLGPYPGATEVGTAADWIDGEVIELDETELAALDRFEGVDRGEYRRVRVATQAGHEVWVYEYRQAVPPGAVSLPSWAKSSDEQRGSVAQEIWRRAQGSGSEHDRI